MQGQAWSRVFCVHGSGAWVVPMTIEGRVGLHDLARVRAKGTTVANGASMVPMDDKVTCRRCRRPLRSPHARAAGIGARCALLASLEALSGFAGALEGPSAAQSVVALVTAFLKRADDQVGLLLDEADLRPVAGLLAAVIALHLEGQPDAVEMLRRVGLAVAQSEAV